MKQLQIVIVGLLTCSAVAKMFDSLISRANIYYQRPPRLGPPEEVQISNVEELSSTKNIKLIIHGYLGSRTHSAIVPVKNAYLAKGFDNIFMADWEQAAGLEYHNSRKIVNRVSVVLGRILTDFMNKLNIQPNDVHVIGHSLGAHIAGGVGQFFNGSLDRVTGLDPALPLFTPLTDDGLHSTAAQFVDVIHTDYPFFGDITPRGHVDFYPNFGHAPQRGCNDADLFTATSCSHFRAVLLYAESIGLPNNFPAIPCALSAIKLHRVNICLHKDIETLAVGDSASAVTVMGEFVQRTATGTFFLQTNDSPPYGLGQNTKIN